MKNGWSFCIVTSGSQDDILQQCIDRVLEEFEGDNNVEIIVVGNTKLLCESTKVRIIPFVEQRFLIGNYVLNKFFGQKASTLSKPGWITRKKNLAARLASYDKLCVMHDYISIDPGWRQAFVDYRDNWNIITNIVLNKDGTRHLDWCVWDFPQIGPGLLPYDKHSSFIYISGAYFCVKRSFFLKHPLNEKLYWGEGEDVEWSCRVRSLTKIQFNVRATVSYLKQKPSDQAPYCKNWVENKKKIEEALGT